MFKIRSVFALAGIVTLIASAPASACGGFPFSQGPGLGTSARYGLSLNAGDVVTVTYSSPGAATFSVSKAGPGAAEVIVPSTNGPVSGVATYIAPTTASDYSFSASRSGGDGQFASVNYTCAAPAPAPVPTLSEWSMILLSLMMAGGAALYLERRRLAA